MVLEPDWGYILCPNDCFNTTSPRGEYEVSRWGRGGRVGGERTGGKCFLPPGLLSRTAELEHDPAPEPALHVKGVCQSAVNVVIHIYIYIYIYEVFGEGNGEGKYWY